MNVRVLLTFASFVSASGCCMPAFLCHPGLMHCPPGGGFGGPQTASPYAAGPPTYRSFHDNLVTTRSQNVPIATGFVGAYQPPIQRVRSVVRQNFRQRLAVVQPSYQLCPPQQFVAAAPVTHSPAYVVAEPRRLAKPWKLPWFSRTTVSDTSLNHSNYSWLPVVNNDCQADTPCGLIGCTTCRSTSPCAEAGCGESLADLPMSPVADRKLSPVPAPPSSSDSRFFSAPTQGRLKPPEIRSEEDDAAEEGVRRSKAEPLPSPPAETQASDGTPEIPEMAEPAPAEADGSPASKPAMSDPINPFDDIEDSEPESSLPVEAEMPQAALRIPNSAVEPLIIPLPNLPTIASHSVDSASRVQQTSHQQPEWTSISLEQGFFQEEAAAHGIHQAMVEQAEQVVPVRRVMIRRRQ